MKKRSSVGPPPAKTSQEDVKKAKSPPKCESSVMAKAAMFAKKPPMGMAKAPSKKLFKLGEKETDSSSSFAKTKSNPTPKPPAKKVVPPRQKSVPPPGPKRPPQSKSVPPKRNKKPGVPPLPKKDVKAVPKLPKRPPVKLKDVGGSATDSNLGRRKPPPKRPPRSNTERLGDKSVSGFGRPPPRLSSMNQDQMRIAANSIEDRAQEDLENAMEERVVLDAADDDDDELQTYQPMSFEGVEEAQKNAATIQNVQNLLKTPPAASNSSAKMPVGPKSMPPSRKKAPPPKSMPPSRKK